MSILESIGRFGAHLIWPASCPFCGALGKEACVGCLLPLMAPPLPEDFGSFPFETGGLHEGIHRNLILELKYGGNRPLGVAMGRALGRIFPTPSCDVIVPVPLHKESDRTFNQSAALAEGLGREWGRPVVEGLAWSRSHAAQTTLGEAERRKMPSDAMAPRGRRVAGKTVVLVDDVSTTGTTLRIAAKALSRGEGKVVLALTWAKAPKA